MPSPQWLPLPPVIFSLPQHPGKFSALGLLLSFYDSASLIFVFYPQRAEEMGRLLILNISNLCSILHMLFLIYDTSVIICVLLFQVTSYSEKQGHVACKYMSMDRVFLARSVSQTAGQWCYPWCGTHPEFHYHLSKILSLLQNKLKNPKS